MSPVPMLRFSSLPCHSHFFRSSSRDCFCVLQLPTRRDRGCRLWNKSHLSFASSCSAAVSHVWTSTNVRSDRFTAAGNDSRPASTLSRSLRPNLRLTVLTEVPIASLRGDHSSLAGRPLAVRGALPLVREPCHSLHVRIMLQCHRPSCCRHIAEVAVTKDTSSATPITSTGLPSMQPQICLTCCSTVSSMLSAVIEICILT